MKRPFLILLAILVSAIATHAQINFGPQAGNHTVCPFISTNYAITQTTSDPDKKCTPITWTITEGHFVTGNGTATTTEGTSVQVVWDDSPKKGKLNATQVCNFTNGQQTFTHEEVYTIESLTGVTPEHATVWPTLPYCASKENKATVSLRVDQVAIPNTGGATSIPQKYAQEYRWYLPDGWSESTTGQRGHFTTDGPAIGATPDDGCVGGAAKVFANTCGVSNSNEVAFDLSRASATVNVTPKSYNSTFCNNNEITFNAPVSCASNYEWNFPKGWKTTGGGLSPIKTTSAFMTLVPSGSKDDVGQIVVKVTLDCGAVLSGTSDIKFVEPTPFVTGPSLICSGNSTFTVGNIPARTTVVGYMSSNTSLLTINSAGVATRVGSPINGAVIITADLTSPCGQLTAKAFTVWVGAPYFPTTIQGPSEVTIDYSARYTIPTPMGATTTSTWSITPDWYIYTSSSINATIVAKSTGLKYLTVTNKNTCGTDMARKSIMGTTSCVSIMSVYPNPSRGDVTVNVIPPPGGCGTEPALAGTSSISSQNDLTIIDSRGEKVYTTKFTGESLSLKRLGLKAGAYIVKVNSQGQLLEQRLLVE